MFRRDPPTLWWLFTVCALLVFAPPDSITSGIDHCLGQLHLAFAGQFPRLGLFLEHLDNLTADDLALLLGIGDARRCRHELPVVDTHAFRELPGEHLHDQPCLVQAQQAVVDEHAGELVADRLPGSASPRPRSPRRPTGRDDDLPRRPAADRAPLPSMNRCPFQSGATPAIRRA